MGFPGSKPAPLSYSRSFSSGNAQPYMISYMEIGKGWLASALYDKQVLITIITVVLSSVV